MTLDVARTQRCGMLAWLIGGWVWRPEMGDNGGIMVACCVWHEQHHVTCVCVCHDVAARCRVCVVEVCVKERESALRV